MVDDTRPIEFTEEDKMKAISDLAVNVANFDMWYPAGSPQQEQYAMFAKYLLIKNEAANKAMKDGKEVGTGIFNIAAQTYENQMIAEQGINLEAVAQLFGMQGTGLDASAIRQIATTGNPFLPLVSANLDLAMQATQANNTNEAAKYQAIAVDNMSKAINHALTVDKRMKMASVGKGVYDVSDAQKKTVNKIRIILPENAKEVFSEMTKAWEGQGSNAQWHGYGKDLSGNGKINYAYTKMDSQSGIRTWYLIDSNGVEIRTNLTEKDVRKEDGMDAVYQAVNNDILSQIQTGVVNYTDRAWAQTVAKQLGYQWDSKTGRVISVRERDASKLSDALYHGFRTEPIGSEEIKEDKDWTTIGIDQSMVSP
jgi:hypothetical protein